MLSARGGQTMVVHWPYLKIDQREVELLIQVHGNVEIHCYSLDDASYPLGILKKIRDHHDGFVYASTPSQVAVASLRGLRFGFMEYDSNGPAAIYHCDAWASEPVRLVWNRPMRDHQQVLDQFAMGVPRRVAMYN